MKTGEWVFCKVCGRKYQAIVPSGGDGSAIYPRKHKRKIPLTNNMGITIIIFKKEYCPGSFIEITEQMDVKNE